MTVPIRPTTKNAIIEAAFEIFTKNPSAPLSDVADRAGVGRATLHRHFAGRDELIRSLALIAMEEMDIAVVSACENAPSYGDAFQRMFTALIPLGDRYGFLTREPIEDDPDVATEIKRQLNETHEMVDNAKREGLFDQNIPTGWIAQASDHLIYAAWESVRAGDTTHVQAADLAWRTLISGLGKVNK